jgi:hypothetical protein
MNIYIHIRLSRGVLELFRWLDQSHDEQDQVDNYAFRISVV